MATIGVLAPAASGHLNPMNSLGRELARRGHRVVVANAPDDGAGAIARRGPGIPRRSAGQDYPTGFDRGPMYAQARRAQRMGVGAPVQRGDHDLAYGEMILRRRPRRASGRSASTCSSSTRGRPAGRPWPTTWGCRMSPSPTPSCSTWRSGHPSDGDPPCAPTRGRPSPGIEGRLESTCDPPGTSSSARIDPLVHLIEASAEAMGPAPLGSDLRSTGSPRSQRSAQQPAEFEFPRRRSSRPHFHFTGPLQRPGGPGRRSPSRSSALDGRPLVYASLGTIQNRLLWGLPGHRRGRRRPRTSSSSSPSAARPTPPCSATLPGHPAGRPGRARSSICSTDAALTITHAGMNTTLESLARGRAARRHPGHQRPARRGRPDRLDRHRPVHPPGSRLTAKRLRQGRRPGPRRPLLRRQRRPSPRRHRPIRRRRPGRRRRRTTPPDRPARPRRRPPDRGERVRPARPNLTQDGGVVSRLGPRRQAKFRSGRASLSPTCPARPAGPIRPGPGKKGSSGWPLMPMNRLSARTTIAIRRSY